jgi:DNA polymerase alpha subunit A
VTHDVCHGGTLPVHGYHGYLCATCVQCSPSQCVVGCVQFDGLMGGDAMLDDEDRFSSLAPLQLTAPDATEFALPNIASFAVPQEGGGAAADPRQLLAPANARAALTPSQLANQVRRCQQPSHRAAQLVVSTQAHPRWPWRGIRCRAHGVPPTDPNVCAQAALAARAVMKRAYDCELKSDDEMLPCTTRDVLLATHHPRLGACAPGTCPPDAQCLGVMEAALPEADAYLLLSHLTRQLDARRAARRGLAEAAADELAQMAPLLDAGHAAVEQLLCATAYHWVSLTNLFGVLCT